MKLLVLAPSYLPKTGGVEKHILETTRVLRNSGHKVTIMVRYSEDIPAVQTVEGVPVLRFPKYDGFLGLLFWLPRNLKVFVEADAIHSHDYFPFPLKRLFGKKKWIHTFHGYEGYPISPAAVKSRQEVRRLTRYCIGIGAFIEKWYGTKCDLISYGAVGLPSKIQPSAKSWDVIFYGRLEADTGFTDYLKGFSKITQQNPHATMLVLGDGSDRAWAEEFIADKGLSVEFGGRVEDIWPYLASSKVAFVSGYLGILEACALGKPVVAHYQTPIKKDYLECHPLFGKFRIASSPATVASEYQLAKNTSKGQLAEAAEWAQQQTWDKIANAYLDQY